MDVVVEGIEMDVTIWKEFPEELMEVVVAKLPIATFFRFRSVCRSWNSYVSSPTFMPLSEESSGKKHPYMIFASYFGNGKHNKSDIKKWRGALYDPYTKKWHHDLTLPSSYDIHYAACSAGGLVCSTDYRGSTFLVGNPLTRTWKKFSFSASHWRGFFVTGMVSLNKDCSRRYKIVRLDMGGEYQVYDSFKESRFSGRVPANINLPSSLYTCSTVSIGNVVYFLCSKHGEMISYDVVNEAWNRLVVPTPPNLCAVALAECGGRMLLVALFKDNNVVGTMYYFSVCELQITSVVWTEVYKIPTSSRLSEFVGGCIRLTCLGSGRLLLIALCTTRNNSNFTYDVVTREWTEVPGFIPLGERIPSLPNLIGFFPSLLASP